MKYNPLWNDEQSYMIRTTGVARWNTYIKTERGNFVANRDIVFTTSFSLFTHDQIVISKIDLFLYTRGIIYYTGIYYKRNICYIKLCV